MSEISAEERIARARIAQRQWAMLPMKQRIRTMARLRDRIATSRERIVDAIVEDVGKPALDALSGEVLVVLEQMLFYERRARHILRDRRIPKPAILFTGCTFREHVEPHGVVLIYAAANYPFQLAIVPAITALFAGNAVLLKVSERTPSVARVVEDLCQAILLPDLLQVSVDEPERAAQYIDAGPNFVFFTGSTATGTEIAKRAATKLIPTVLELGGKDAAIVLNDCDLDRTTEGIVYGAFSNAGQVCVGIKRLYIQRPLYRELLDRLVTRTATLCVGTVHDSDFGTLQPYSRERFTAQIHDALARGALLEAADPVSGTRPVILSDVPVDARLLTEESFGPVLCVTPFATEEEAITLANSSSFALSASVWTKDLKRGRNIASRLNAGSCAINDVIRNIANPYASFGGNASSGYGRYHGPAGLRTFTRVKSIMSVHPRRQREVHWFPLTAKTFDRLSAWIGLRHRSRTWTAPLRRLLPAAVLAIVVIASSSAQAPREADLQLKVQLPENNHGSIAYAVFASPDGFPRDTTKAVRHGFVEPLAGGLVALIDAGRLPPGRYAVSVYLDANGNHKLDVGLFGIPKEPVGASNNPGERSGPPRFSECAFHLDSGDLIVPITLIRPR